MFNMHLDTCLPVLHLYSVTNLEHCDSCCSEKSTFSCTVHNSSFASESICFKTRTTLTHLSSLRSPSLCHTWSLMRISSLMLLFFSVKGRSRLKFINFVSANEAAAVSETASNKAEREAGGGCCLATAGRI